MSTILKRLTRASRSPENMSGRRQMLFVFFVVAGLVTAFWWPTLFEGKSLIHGDSIQHGLPMLALEARSLNGDANLLWSNEIFGGHPVFAESSGAFAHPLNLLLAWLVPPIYGYNLFQFFCMLISAIGTFGFCRSLGTSNWAAGFGSLSVTFAPVWIHSHHNLAIAGALAWVPATMWATEFWLTKLSIARSILLAVMFCFLVFAGYPQVVHGAAIYIASSLIPFFKDQRDFFRTNWQKFLIAGGIVALLGVGFAAVQILPLLELASLSHRSNGIAILFPWVPASIYLRGFLFSLAQHRFFPIQQFPGAGSILVCVMASAILLLNPSPRIKGHIVATFILLQLGLCMGSPLFRIIYRCHLIPGLHFFRAMFIYLCISIVGMAALSSSAIDKLALVLKDKNYLNEEKSHLSVVFLFFIPAWIWVVRHYYVPNIPWQNFATIVLAFIGVFMLAMIKRASSIPILLFTLLTIECASLRLHEFHFGDSTLLEKPASLVALSKKYQLDDYKFFDSSFAHTYTMGSPLDNNDANMQRMLSAASALTNLMWGVPSINGALALPLRSRKMLDSLFEDEVRGKNVTAPGQRAIDVLGVRFIAVDAPRDVPGFRVAYHDSSLNTWIMENTAALPRLQTYTRNVAVSSADAALALLKTPRESELIIEDDKGFVAPSNDHPNDPDAIKYELREAESTHYVLNVHASRAGWLFLADANYPGWSAVVDGRSTPVFSAQLLGKAIAIPVGNHKIEFNFSSATFRRGLMISCVSIFIAALLLVYERQRSRKMELQTRKEDLTFP